MANTPVDSYGRPAILGNNAGVTVPVLVDEEGRVCVSTVSEEPPVKSLQNRYELVTVLTLDLLQYREKEKHTIDFDSFAVANLTGSFFMHIGSDEDTTRCTINRCLSVGVTAEAVYIK